MVPDTNSLIWLQFVMALSNPLHGPRKEGTVGKPLPRVEVCYDFLVVRDIVKKRFKVYSVLLHAT
jgi:hypothetical protein